MKRFLILFFLPFVPVVYAHCPLCTAAVGSGLMAARYYGIADTVVGLWTGAFIISTALWMSVVLKRKTIHIPFQDTVIVLSAFLLTVVPFYFAGMFHGMHMFGINALLFGILFGMLISYTGFYMSGVLKKKRGSVVPYQTIILTIGLLVLFSIILA